MASSVRAGAPLILCFESADVRPWRTSERTGLNFELLSAAAKSAGVALEYVALPWKRCLTELKANRVDGAFAASFKQDRLELGVYPGGASADAEKRLHMDSYVLIRKRNTNVDWNGVKFSSLDGPIGIQLGYSVGEQLLALNAQVDEGSLNARELLMKLASGRIVAAAALSGEVHYLLAGDPEFVRQFEVLPRPIVEKPYYLILSHRFRDENGAVAEALWKAIEKVRNSPAYRKAEERAFKEMVK